MTGLWKTLGGGFKGKSEPNYSGGVKLSIGRSVAALYLRVSGGGFTVASMESSRSRASCHGPTPVRKRATRKL